MGAVSDRSELLELEEVSSRVYPSLERAPGKKDNWVESAGKLPSYIERIAKHLHYEQGFTIGHSIASAVNTIKRWCSGGSVSKTKGPSKSNVKPATKAKACKALAEWEALKAKNKAKNIKEARQIRLDHEYLEEHAVLAEDERTVLLESFQRRLLVVEGMGSTLSEATTRGRAAVVKGALELLESPDWSVPQLAPLGWNVADPREQARAAKALRGEAQELRCIIDALGGELQEAVDGDEVGKAERRIEKGRDQIQQARLDDKTVNLTRGSKGALVEKAQARLQALGYDVADDGDFGPKTDRVVRDFQVDHGLKRDGELGPRTRWAMRGTTPEEAQAQAEQRMSPNGDTPEDGDQEVEAPDGEEAAEETPPTAPWLAKGMGWGGEPDPNVQAAQEALIGLGTHVGDAGADGKFGPETEKGVKRIQRRYGLKPDGMIGPKTHDVLGQGEELEEAPWSITTPEGTTTQAHARKWRQKDQRAAQKTASGSGGGSGNFDESKHKRAPAGSTGGGRFVSKGDSGSAVRNVQRSLGVDAPSGNFDRKTERAVREFQRDNGLQVDGVIGAQTAAALLGDQEQDPGELRAGQLKQLRKRRELQEATLRGAARAVIQKIRRLPDGTFAPAGRGRVLKPGDNVKGDGIRGKVNPDGRSVKTSDGADVPLAPESATPAPAQPKPSTRKPSSDIPPLPPGAQHTVTGAGGRKLIVSRDGDKYDLWVNGEAKPLTTGSSLEAVRALVDKDKGAGDGQSSPSTDHYKRWKNSIASTRKEVAGQDDELGIADDIAEDLADEFAQAESFGKTDDQDALRPLIEDVDRWRRELDPSARPTLESDAYQERRDYYDEHGPDDEQDLEMDGQASPGDDTSKRMRGQLERMRAGDEQEIGLAVVRKDDGGFAIEVNGDSDSEGLDVVKAEERLRELNIGDGQRSPGDGQNSPGLSPARSGQGNIRNIKAMGDVKLAKLREEMRDYVGEDPDAVEAINAELDARGIDPIEGSEGGIVDSTTTNPGSPFSELPDGTVFKQGSATLEKTGPTTAKALKDESGKLTLGTNYSVNPNHTPDEVIDSEKTDGETSDPESPGEMDAPSAPAAAAVETASGLGSGWSPELVLAALDQLAGKGIKLDPEVESAETLMAVIKAAEITPGGISKPTTGVV